MRTFSTGATRDAVEGKVDYRGALSPEVLERFAQYMLEHSVQADGKPRLMDNWKKGIPREEYLSSLLRHVVDTWQQFQDGKSAGVRFQDTLCACLFNVQGLLYETLRGKVKSMTFEDYLRGQFYGEMLESHLRCARGASPEACGLWPDFQKARSASA